QIELYCGDAGAWATASAAWPGLERSLQMKLPCMNAEFLFVYARCALAAVQKGPCERRRLAVAERCVRRLDRNLTPAARPMADLVRSALLLHRSHAMAAIDLLDQAARRFDAAEMALYAAVARRRRGELLGGGEGRALCDAANDFMRNEEIRNPDA